MKHDEKLFNLLNRIPYGTIAFVKDGKPFQFPVNFVYFNDAVYFHGSSSNKHFAIIEINPFVSFCAFLPYSRIPSYATGALACYATQFFESVIIEGEVVLVRNTHEKIDILTAMMKKLQPEGNYNHLNAKSYNAILKSTKVFGIIPKQIHTKFKFGQDYDDKRYQRIVSYLEQKGDDLSVETLKKMKEYRRNEF